MMTHDDMHAALPAFALDALDPAERSEIEQHLAGGCDTCRQELSRWQEVVGLVALADAETPPAALKPLLLQRARAVAAGAPKIPLRLIVPLAAAATAVLVWGAVHDSNLRTELEQQTQVASSLRIDLNVARENLKRAGAQLAAKEQDLAGLRASLATAEQSLAILQAPGLRMVHLKQTPQAQPAEAHALISTDAHRALFYAFDLPPAAAGKVYELWWITEKEGPVNAGIFAPDSRGLGRIEASVPTDAGVIQAAAVTIEPAGGLPKPTGPMVLLGNLETRS